MARMKVKLDRAGMAEVLASGAVQGAVDEIASAVFDTAGAHDAYHRHRVPLQRTSHGVQLRADPSPRAGAQVTARHAGAVPIERKYGVLVEAARAAGVEVRPK